MDYAKKLAYQSNYWYNDGLQKANIYDLSGAIASLKRSLQYRRENTEARNLLGLLYYGRGEVAEALVEWIISKNLKSSENIANYYITKVQESAAELDTINQAIRKYNQCLTYCQQNGEDLAIIQLKKVVSAHSTFLKAYQLLALLYLKTEQYPKARQALRRAHKLDKTNDITLLYMHELSQGQGQKKGKKKVAKDATITYNLGNETIIQPAPSGLKEASPMATIVNILIGIAVGAAVMWFLIVPALKQSQLADQNKEVLGYSDQIESKEGQIRALKKELEGYRLSSDATEQEQAAAANAQESYEALLKATAQFESSSVSDADMAEGMLSINQNALGEEGKAVFKSVADELFPRVCEKKIKSGTASYEAANYAEAIKDLEQVTMMEEGYNNGEALLTLANAYQKNGDAEKAKTAYNRVIELYPETDNAKQADEALKGNTNG